RMTTPTQATVAFESKATSPASAPPASFAPQRLKGHELRYVLLEPFLPFLYRRVRAVLTEIIDRSPAKSFELLDVGGRKSPYTIGLAAQVTVSDLKRESDVQKQLNLGFTDSLVEHLKTKRSNV